MIGAAARQFGWQGATFDAISYVDVENEVLGIRDNANTTAVPVSAAFALEEERRYRDIVPQECWKEWQRVRSLF